MEDKRKGGNANKGTKTANYTAGVKEARTFSVVTSKMLFGEA